MNGGEGIIFFMVDGRREGATAMISFLGSTS